MVLTAGKIYYANNANRNQFPDIRFWMYRVESIEPDIDTVFCTVLNYMSPMFDSKDRRFQLSRAINTLRPIETLGELQRIYCGFN